MGKTVPREDRAIALLFLFGAMNFFGIVMNHEIILIPQTLIVKLFYLKIVLALLMWLR